MYAKVKLFTVLEHCFYGPSSMQNHINTTLIIAVITSLTAARTREHKSTVQDPSLTLTQCWAVLKTVLFYRDYETLTYQLCDSLDCKH